MKPEYKIVTYTDGIQRVYYAHKYYDGACLADLLTRQLPYVELWEGTRLLLVYDAQSQLLA
jgi:hypothetical protein